MCAKNMLETCNIFSIDSLKSSSNKFNGLFLLSLNVRSCSKNFDVFSSYIYKLNIMTDVIILTETRFSEGNTDNNPCYVSFNSARSEKSGGAVSVFLKNDLDCRITEINNVSSESIEFVHIKL